jgi:hypothetical protein
VQGLLALPSLLLALQRLQPEGELLLLLLLLAGCPAASALWGIRCTHMHAPRQAPGC